MRPSSTCLPPTHSTSTTPSAATNAMPGLYHAQARITRSVASRNAPARSANRASSCSSRPNAFTCRTPWRLSMSRAFNAPLAFDRWRYRSPAVVVYHAAPAIRKGKGARATHASTGFVTNRKAATPTTPSTATTPCSVPSISNRSTDPTSSITRVINSPLERRSNHAAGSRSSRPYTCRRRSRITACSKALLNRMRTLFSTSRRR